MTDRREAVRQGERRRENREQAASSRERDERYQQLVEQAPEGILIHDGEQIVLANDAAIQLAGGTHREQLVGRAIDDFLHPPHLKAIEALLLEAGSQAQRTPPVRDSFRRLDGSEVEVEVTAIAFLDHGRPSAHLVIQDVTQRLAAEHTAHLAEERLQHSQRMEAVGALAGGVAHEVNNMMSVILGFSEFLLKDPTFPGDRLSDLHHIVTAAERTAMVTRQLLAFSRRSFHQPRVLDLEATLRDLEPVVRRLLGEDRELATSYESSPRVRADKGQLEQVIVNLALNARDAMPSGGRLTITLGQRELAPHESDPDIGMPAGKYATVSVQDSGVGMDPATLERAFEPFFTTKPLGQGTGLGLAAAEGIMKQNDGGITVATQLGTGTTFTLHLPLYAGNELRERRNDPPQPAVNEGEERATILLVEDEAAVRAVALQSLERAGFRVLEASEGAAALALMDRHGPPDLLLTDLMMPGVGGADLARRARARWPKLPVLFMSGYSVEDLRRHTAVDFEGVLIQKPFTPDTLARRVAGALQRRKLDRQSGLS